MTSVTPGEPPSFGALRPRNVGAGHSQGRGQPAPVTQSPTVEERKWAGVKEGVTSPSAPYGYGHPCPELADLEPAARRQEL